MSNRPSARDLIEGMLEDGAEPVKIAEVDGWECPGCERKANAAERGFTHADNCPVGLGLDEMSAEDRAWGESHPWAAQRRRKTWLVELMNPVLGDGCLQPDHYRTTVTYSEDKALRHRSVNHLLTEFHVAT